MKKSDSIKELAQAMKGVQAVMPSVTMNAVNPFLKNKFADLGAVISTLRPLLPEYGLSYSQMPYSEAGKVGVTTLIMHASGEWIESDVSIDLAEEKGKSAAQVAGSVITYLRRYSLTAAFGMFADEDTDGNHEEKKPAKKEYTEAEKQQIMVDKYAALVARAKAVKMELPVLDAGWNSDKMKAHFREQERFVIAAELQTKAGE